MKHERGSASLETLLAVAFLLIPTAALLAQMPQWVATSHAVQVAASEAARTVVLADTFDLGVAAANQVVFDVVTNHGQDPADLVAVEVDGSFARGGAVTVTVQLRGNRIVVPGLGSVGPAFVATGSATERVDDYRSFP